MVNTKIASALGLATAAMLGVGLTASAELVSEISVVNPLDPGINALGSATISSTFFCERDSGNTYDHQCDVEGGSFKSNKYTIWYCGVASCSANGYSGATDGTVDILLYTSSSSPGDKGFWSVNFLDGLPDAGFANWNGPHTHMIGGDFFHAEVQGYFATEAKRA